MQKGVPPVEKAVQIGRLAVQIGRPAVQKGRSAGRVWGPREAMPRLRTGPEAAIWSPHAKIRSRSIFRYTLQWMYRYILYSNLVVGGVGSRGWLLVERFGRGRGEFEGWSEKRGKGEFEAWSEKGGKVVSLRGGVKKKGIEMWSGGKSCRVRRSRATVISSRNTNSRASRCRPTSPAKIRGSREASDTEGSRRRQVILSRLQMEIGRDLNLHGLALLVTTVNVRVRWHSGRYAVHDAVLASLDGTASDARMGDEDAAEALPGRRGLAGAGVARRSPRRVRARLPDELRGVRDLRCGGCVGGGRGRGGVGQPGQSCGAADRRASVSRPRPGRGKHDRIRAAPGACETRNRRVLTRGVGM